MSWSLIVNAVLGLLVVLIGVAAAALAVEIVRDRSFEHRSRGDTRHGWRRASH